MPSSCLSLAVVSAVAMTAPAPAEVSQLPQALLDAAYKTEDPVGIAAVAEAVKAVFSDEAEAIDAQAAARVAALIAVEEAATASAPPPVSASIFALQAWDGEMRAGGSWASGNSDNAAASFGLEGVREYGIFSHNVKAYLDFAKSEGDLSQKRWGVSYQFDAKLRDGTFAYARVSYDEDEFSGFDYRLFAGGGLGHFLWENERLIWKVEGGPGFRYSPIDDTQEIEKEFAVYAASETDWTIRSGVVFEQDLSATWTSPTTTIQSISSLKTDLTDAISTAISFEYRYETDPPLGREKADTIARASLIYGF